MYSQIIPKISVCIAVYNGGEFLDYQLNSIINNLIDDYLIEIIIVDDKSTDNSSEICNKFRNIYKSITFKLIQNTSNVGHVFTFEKALLASNSDFIMLSDQDDFWPKGRIKVMFDMLKKNRHIDLLIGDFIEESSNNLKNYRDEFQIKSLDVEFKLLSLNDFIFKKYPFYGCCMAFRSDLLKNVIPFPNWIDTHDRWIAACSIINNSAYFLEKIVTVRGLHSKNKTSSKRTQFQRLKSFSKKLCMVILVMFRKAFLR